MGNKNGLGGISGSCEPSPAVSALSGFDPGRRKHIYALTEAGWIGGIFVFGGNAEMAALFGRCGIIDSEGFTALGSRLRDTYGRGKAGLPDRRTA